MTNWTRLAVLTLLPDHSPQSTRDQSCVIPPQYCLNPVLTATNKTQHGAHQSSTRAECFKHQQNPSLSRPTEFDKHRFTRNNIVSHIPLTKHLSEGLHFGGQLLLLIHNYPENLTIKAHHTVHDGCFYFSSLWTHSPHFLLLVFKYLLLYWYLP